MDPRKAAAASAGAAAAAAADSPSTRAEAREAERRRRSRKRWVPPKREGAATGGRSGRGGRDRSGGGSLPALSSPSLREAAREENPSPRRSTRVGDGFPGIVGWTSLGTAFPGLGMIRGKNSRLGWFLLIGFFAGILAVMAWVIYRGPVRAAGRIISSPLILNTTAILLILGTLLWLFVILRTYAILKRGELLRSSQKLLGGVLVASLMICIAVPLGVGAGYARVQGSTISQVFGNSGGLVQDKQDLWADTPRINVFLIGRDTGEGREGTRPDTQLVASIDTRTGATTLISVPRNLALPIFPEGSQLASVFPYGFNAFGPQESMINAVWTWAEQNPDQVGDTGGLEPGMFATMQAVEGSLGLQLDYFASVDMEGFEDVVDAIGGVDIVVERPIPMGGGTNLNTGMKNKIHGWIDPGPQTLDGYEALWYVRSREGSDNYDRMCRQQRMIKTTLDQVDPQEIAMAYPKLAGSAGKNVATDIPQHEVPAFVELAVDMQSAEIKSAQINNDVVDTTNPDFEALHTWVQDQVNPQVDSQAEQEAQQETTEAGAAGEESPAAPTDEPAPEDAGGEGGQGGEDPAPGIENTEGMCFPEGYTPGDPWPGYPGPTDAGAAGGAGAGAAGAADGTGADTGAGAAGGAGAEAGRG
ncbi:LCP family protein [Brevibacterium daeguense]|uniref:LCP family protein n=1 Tax=Brevibacterium daeguense TaxID=909936 RepID=UPI001F169950